MKKSFVYLALSFLLFACNNEKKNDDKGSGDKKEEKKMGDDITYAYKANYSSDFSMGDPRHSKLVLDFIKMWEENRMTAMRPLLTDTVSVSFADGSKYEGAADSLLKGGQEFRNSFSSVKVTVEAWEPIHLNDKNEDYVLVWERDYNTDKNGKVDSVMSHVFYEIKNNKISSWYEMQAKLAPPPAMNNK